MRFRWRPNRRILALKQRAKTAREGVAEGGMEMAYVLTHATVLDGTEQMEPQPNMTVVVDDGGRIDRVGPAASTVGPLGAREIDLGGAYLMPGLINAHVHLCGSGKPMSAGGAGDLIDKVVGNPVGMWALRRMIRGHAQAQLASGVTTVRSVGDPGFADVDVRDAIDAGKCAGPRLLTSGVGVTVPGGHGAGLFAKVVSTPEEARDFAATARENGFGVIIAAAGKAAHLAGAMAANTTLPVIGVPVKSSTLDGLDALLSTVQMPPGMPVATVAIDGAKNAALLAAQIIAVEDSELAERLMADREATKAKILEKDARIRAEFAEE